MALIEKNQLRTAKCGSGGVGLFLKNSLLNDWEFNVLDNTIDGLYITTLVNKKTECKIMLVPCYLPPETSNWGNESDVFFNHITSMLYSYEDDIDILIGGGDFNARIGSLDDFLEGSDEINKRKPIDPETNKHGEAFIDFLLSTKLCVLNGRVPGEDNYTFVKSQGKSVVDYLVTQIDNLNI